MSECMIDGKTTSDGYRLCYSCGEQLEYDLAEVSGVLADLGAVVTRKAKGAPSVGGGSSSENALPLDFDAMHKGKTLVELLWSWYTMILEPFEAEWRTECARITELPADDRPESPRWPGCKDGKAGDTSAWLLHHIDHIRKHDWAADMKAEVREALNQCRRASDRVDERVFAGMCPTDNCGAPVYVKAGKPLARCRVCTFTWDVSEWRARALDYARFEIGTAAQISRMLTDPATGEALPAGTIRSWASRDKLTPTGETRKGKPTYYLNDVREVWVDMKASAYGNPSLKAVC